MFLAQKCRGALARLDRGRAVYTTTTTPLHRLSSPSLPPSSSSSLLLANPTPPPHLEDSSAGSLFIKVTLKEGAGVLPGCSAGRAGPLQPPAAPASHGQILPTSLHPIILQMEQRGSRATSRNTTLRGRGFKQGHTVPWGTLRGWDVPRQPPPSDVLSGAFLALTHPLLGPIVVGSWAQP